MYNPPYCIIINLTNIKINKGKESDTHSHFMDRIVKINIKFTR